MSRKAKYAKRGALIVGIPFSLWSLLILITVLSSNDPSQGALVSFGIVLPAAILGFPWSLGLVIIGAKIPELSGNTVIGYVGLGLIILGPMINGALVGYRIGATDDKSFGEDET